MAPMTTPTGTQIAEQALANKAGLCVGQERN